MQALPAPLPSRRTRRGRENSRPGNLIRQPETIPFDEQDTPFGPLKSSDSWLSFRLERRKTVVDTMTYASVAVLPWSIAEDRTHPVLPEVELIRLDVSMIK